MGAPAPEVQIPIYLYGNDTEQGKAVSITTALYTHCLRALPATVHELAAGLTRLLHWLRPKLTAMALSTMDI